MASIVDSRRGVFAVLEGLTGVGKSTAAKRVAEQLGMRFISPMSTEFLDARNLLDSDSRMLDARYAFYFASILHAASEINDLLDSGEHVIVDSWIYRTHATHKALGSRLTLKPPSWIPEPDVKVLLTCDEEERKRRIASRSQVSPYWKSLCDDVSEDVLAWYRKNIKKLVEVTVSYKVASSAVVSSDQSTTELSIERMVGDVVAKIRPLIRSRNETLVRTSTPDERYFLQHDLDDLDQKIAFTKELIKEAKIQGQEATEQSSESWHDNYNFEESQRNLRMYQNNLGSLSNAREKAVVVDPANLPDHVSVGHRVTLKVIGRDSVAYIDLGSYMVGDDFRRLGFISYDAAAAKGLLGLKIGEKATLHMDGERAEVEVVAYEVSPLLEAPGAV